MKCPKCGYLGFEATDRCRNCGYDFAFHTPATPADLSLGADDRSAPPVDLALQLADVPDRSRADDSAEGPAVDLPLFAPRPAGTPLAVRRPAGDAPRPRRAPRTVTPAPPLPLLVETPESPASASTGSEPGLRAEAPVPAHVGRRLAAAVIDIGLLGAIDVGVAGLTLRLLGLPPTPAGAALLPLVPLGAFFGVLGFLYLVGFSVGGGQTIGKMLTRIRVTGDDGRGVDLTGAVVRAVALLGVVASLGLAYLPVLMAGDRRGLHDRLAGTRVVPA